MVTRHGRAVASAPGGGALQRSELAPLALTFLAGGITTSLVVSQWAEPWVVVLAAVVMYSATGELALVAVLAAGGTVVAGVLSGLLVSARFGLLCVALAQRFRAPWPQRAVAAFVSVDVPAAPGGVPVLASVAGAGLALAVRRRPAPRPAGDRA